MKWLRRIAVGAAVLAMVLLVGGLLLPRETTVRRSIVVAAPPADVFVLVDDMAGGWRRWDPFVGDGVAASVSGVPRGVGAALTLTNRDGAVLSRMTLVGSDPPHAVDYQLEVPSGMASRGRIALDADGAGTRVTWQHHIDFGGNPLQRWRGLVVDAYLGSKFARGLDALAHAVDQTRASHRDGA